MNKSMNSQQQILKLKATLFDFNDLFTDKSNRFEDLMRHSYEKITNILKSTNAIIFISNQQLARLAPIEEHSSFKQYISTDQQYLQYFHDQFIDKHQQVLFSDAPMTLRKKQHDYYIVMRLTLAENFKGYYLFTFDTVPEMATETMIEMQQIIDKHFKLLCDYFHEQLIHKRNQMLFQLSTTLHSIYSTIDVLKRVYRSATSLYPHFEYRFLMSHEYDDTTLPVYTMEYYNHHDFLGTKAFMNNKLQIDQVSKDNNTIIYAPLTGRQGVYGVFEIMIPMSISLTDSDIDFITQSSKMIGRAVERTTLYQSSTQLVTDLQYINVASRDLNRNLEKDEISESVKKHIVDSCQAEEIGIVFLPRGEQEDHPYVITEESTPYFKLTRAKEFVYYLYKKLLENPEPVLSGNFNVEDIPIPFNSVMVIPMLDSERMFGFIVIAHEKPYYFSFDKYKFVQSFVQHAALAYANSILKAKLRETAITDYLTGLFMRNYLDEKIDQHMNHDVGGSFMLLDIDDFKLINDTYGHYVGDKVLIQIANILQRTINDNEIAARWGGEEFAVYLPYGNEKYAEEVADQIRTTIKGKTNPQVTVSIGISSWSNEHQSIEELFIKADEALYKAKETGKNRIKIAS